MKESGEIIPNSNLVSTSALVSVILPLYNAELYIEEAVRSILDQTYRNLELIIIDDGSNDNSAAIVRAIKDERIMLCSQENQGMAASLNKGLTLAKGEFIARQDADDISYPLRLEKQIAFLKENPDKGLVGTWARIISTAGEKSWFHKHPSENLILKLFLLFDNPFVHSSVMMRKSIIDTIGNYDEKKSALTQDYDLWSRIARNYAVANIPEVLQYYRKVESGISHTTSSFASMVIKQSIENLSYYENLCYSESGSSDTASDLANLYHSDYQNVNRNLSNEKMEEAFMNITNKVLVEDLTAVSSARFMQKAYLNLLKRKLKRYKKYGRLLIVFRALYKKLR